MITRERIEQLFGMIPPRGILVRCPCHNDNTASLHIKLQGDLVLLHCFAGCSFVTLSRALQGESYKPEKVALRARVSRPVAPFRFIPNVNDKNIHRLVSCLDLAIVADRYPAKNLMYLSRFGVQSVLVYDSLLGGQMMPLVRGQKYGQVKKLTLPGTNCHRPLCVPKSPEFSRIVIAEGISDYLALYALPERTFDVCCMLGASHRPTVEDLSTLNPWPTVLLGFDNDEAGAKATRYYREICPRSISYPPPSRFNDWRDAICHATFIECKVFGPR